MAKRKKGAKRRVAKHQKRKHVAIPFDWKSYAVVLSAFFMSGLCGLSYEVVWSRMLSLVFGNTTQAISTVLAIYMLGLGVGSWVASKLISSKTSEKRLLSAYGVIEVAIGLFAVALPLLIQLVQEIHTYSFSAFLDAPVQLAFIRILLSCVVLLPPTVLMGATLPVLGQYLSRKYTGDDSGKIGILYSVNTLGAAGGALLSAFLFIPNIGLYGTIYLSSGLNVCIGAAIIYYARQLFSREGEAAEGTASEPTTPEVARYGWREILPLFSLGLVGMLLQNAWSHSFVLIFGSSVYAFATMLSTFLIGLGAGSLVASRVLKAVRSVGTLVAGSFLLLAVGVWFSVSYVGALPDHLVQVFSPVNVTWGEIIWNCFWACFAAMIVPTFLSGFLFPLLVRMIAAGRIAGKSAADAYVFNTAGTIVGSLLAGFLIIPTWGAETTLVSAAACCVGMAVLIVASEQIYTLRTRGVAAALIVCLAAVGIVHISAWDTKAMHSGVYAYARQMNGTSATPAKDLMARYELLFHDEGLATVAVFESANGHRFLRINGKTDGSSEGDNLTQMLLGYLPWLYQEDGAGGEALVLGLGTGITSGCVLDLPYDSVDTIEISPEVIRAASYFDQLNSKVFEDERSTIYPLDGRTWVMAADKKYDVIVSEPSNPWQTGNANLFTHDFFRMVRDRLQDDGVLCQWLPFYHMDEEHFKIILRSLVEVFPHVNLWMTNTDTLIISSSSPLALSGKNLGHFFANERVRDNLASMGVRNVEDLASFYYLDADSVVDLIGDVSTLNLDSFPIVEFESPKYIYGPTKPDLLFEIMNNSYDAEMRFQDAERRASLEVARTYSRENYYKRWGMPPYVFENMLRKRKF